MHKARACIITCIDHRFHDRIVAFLKEKGYHGCSDKIIIAGGSRDFIVPVEESDGKYVWKQLGLSIKLHDPDEIVIMDHQDCGGYAQDGTIPAGLEVEEDKKRHRGFCKKFQKEIKKKYPKVKTSFYYIPMHGVIEQIVD